MFNDSSTVIRHLATRRSGKPRDMVAPGPDAETLAAIVELASRTPDHGKLFPWRFVVIGADQRAALAALLARAFAAANPEARASQIEAAAAMAREAPALVVLLSAPQPAAKIPLWEQELSAGAAAMNFLHAAHAHGFVASWITGWAAYDDTVRRAFAEAGGERIAGFLFVGSAGRPLEERPRPPLDQVLRKWAPEG